METSVLLPLFVLLLLYVLQLCVLQSQQYIVIIITLYIFKSFEEAERRNGEYIFIEFVILTYLFTVSGSLHWCQRI